MAHSSPSCREPQWGQCSGHLTWTKVRTTAEGSECSLSSVFWVPCKAILFVTELFLALTLEPWKSQECPKPFCLAKEWYTEKATATGLAFYYMWMTRVNLPLWLGEFPCFPWSLTHIWPLLPFLWYVFCSARLPFTVWKDCACAGPWLLVLSDASCVLGSLPELCTFNTCLCIKKHGIF